MKHTHLSVVLTLSLFAACKRGEPPPTINLSTRAALTGATGVVGVEGITAFDRLTPAELQRLRGANVLWGHQSVGRDLIGGASALGYPFSTVSGAADYGSVHLGEALIPENRDPERKIRSFTDLFVGHSIGSAVQVAAFKFCWIDFSTDTDLDALLTHYTAAVEQAQQRYPNVRFFHVTPPITSDEPRENRVRVEFGRRLRERFASRAVVLDLSEIQSTRDDGTRCVRDRSAVLCDQYRSDEGHFNPEGARRAAKAFLFAIARSLPQAP